MTLAAASRALIFAPMDSPTFCARGGHIMAAAMLRPTSWLATTAAILAAPAPGSRRGAARGHVHSHKVCDVS